MDILNTKNKLIYQNNNTKCYLTKNQRYKEIEIILDKLINQDISYLIIKKLKYIENLVKCEKCKKTKHKKEMGDVEYLCSYMCGFCGICISSNNICYKCLNE